MAARIVSCLGAGVCEALPVQLVNDIFFLHERGVQLGYYTCNSNAPIPTRGVLKLTGIFLVALCLAALATLPAAYMLPTRYSWRLFFYVILAFAVALFILAFLFVEETSYERTKLADTSTVNEDHDSANATSSQDKPEMLAVEHAPIIPQRKPFLSTLQPWGRIDRTIPVFTLYWRSMTYILVPQVLWVITSFGIIIGLGGLSFNFIFPIKITEPPYNWPAVSFE